MTLSKNREIETYISNNIGVLHVQVPMVSGDVILFDDGVEISYFWTRSGKSTYLFSVNHKNELVGALSIDKCEVGE